MCTFFVKKPNQRINKEHFVNIIDNNPQGFGFVYTTGTKLMIVKSPSPDAEVMWKKFCDAESKFPKSHFIGHGRIATGSKLTNENTHPFLVNKGLAIVHNGILRDFPSTAQKSDTVQYIEQVLRKMPTDFYKNRSIMDMVGRDISSSKFAMLTVENKVYVVNRHLCVIDGVSGVLFSNSNFRATEYFDYGGKKVAKVDFGKKNKSYQYQNSTIHKQSEIGFHVDSESCEIQENTFSDWIHCEDCKDWVKKHEFSYEWGVCNKCEDEYGLKDTKNGYKTVQGKYESELNYCDDCGMNVASHSYEDWRICDLCIGNYKKEDSNQGLPF